MKNLILLFSILLYSAAAYGQGYYMNGRFSNTTPDLSLQIDSAAFNFTNTNYTYFINDNATPSSFGTYYVLAGPPDTLVLVEDSLGVCSVNGSGTTVMLDIDKTLTPFMSIILSETTMSQDSCPTHSARMSGDFISTGGVIIEVPASVKATSASTLLADVYNGHLRITGQYDEKVSMDIINVAGQKVASNASIVLRKGQTTNIPIDHLGAGVYFARIRTARELKVLKFAQ